ncbi:MAG: NAD(P)-dependent oxidoreductase [Actinomycetota bacterium]|jgi:3-hydroxyisobutyrate dehydrogenase|nr:NAD(P)-dependent oxidoreductase [Actinomycetota bacterium]
MKPKLGFVGLGNMGSPMCRHLLDRGYEVYVNDADAEAMERLRGTSARVEPSLSGLAGSSDAVLLSLPNSDVVEGVVFGDGGLAEGLASGSVVIDTSSSRPSSTREVAGELARRGVHMLDAPVSGGVLRAREGRLAVMVGGERAVFERYREVIGAFGEKVFYVGESGAGHLTKVINNLMSAATLATAAEAVLLGVRAGLEAKRVIEVVNASSGRSNSTEVKFPEYILNGAFDDGFAIDLMNKDVKIALAEAADLGFPMLLGGGVGQVWQAAASGGYGAESHTAIYAFLEELAGTQSVETK